MTDQQMALLMERLVREEMLAAVADLLWPGATPSLEDHVHRLVERLVPVVERAGRDAAEEALTAAATAARRREREEARLRDQAQHEARLARQFGVPPQRLADDVVVGDRASVMDVEYPDREDDEEDWDEEDDDD